MHHIRFLKMETPAGASQMTLLTKATGRFYTPEAIGRRLAFHVVKQCKMKAQTISVIDPFCGDGRLLVWFLEVLEAHHFSGQVVLEGWDLDAEAVLSAKASIELLTRSLPFSITYRIRKVDTLASTLSRRFDVVLTNPPWDVLKPDRRDLDCLTKSQQVEYVSHLRAQSDLLRLRFPHSQPSAKFSRWAQSLSRIGTEASLKLLAAGGVCGIVFPAALLADQASGKLREWMFGDYCIESVDFYSAELKLFKGVDQPSVAVTISTRKPARPTIAVGVASKDGEVEISALNRATVASLGNRIPLTHGVGGLELQDRLSSLPVLQSLEQSGVMWAGRELDETGHERYLESSGNFGFVKGRMVGRFELLEKPSSFISKNGPPIPKSSQHWRLAWRDVSRPNQKRRMQATLLAPSMVTGNSLNVAYMLDGNQLRLKWLLAVMNSLVFEFQMRSFSATSHISLSTARIVRIPLMERKLEQKLSSLAEIRLAGNAAVEPSLEVAVAKAYGLKRKDFELVVSSFPKLEAPLKAELISLW